MSYEERIRTLMEAAVREGANADGEIAALQRHIAELKATPPPAPLPPATPPQTGYTTMHNARLESGKTYRRVRFTGGTAITGVLHIAHNLRDVVIVAARRDGTLSEGVQAEMDEAKKLGIPVVSTLDTLAELRWGGQP